MAVVAVDFIHMDREFTKGTEVDDNDPFIAALIAAAPHLFVEPIKPKRKR